MPDKSLRDRLPGILILFGTFPSFRKRADAQAMMRGANAVICRAVGFCALQSHLDQRGHRPSGLRHRAVRLRSSDGVEWAVFACRDYQHAQRMTLAIIG